VKTRQSVTAVTFAWHMRQIHAGCASHPRIRCKCCAHLPREERATRDATWKSTMQCVRCTIKKVNISLPFLYSCKIGRQCSSTCRPFQMRRCTTNRYIQSKKDTPNNRQSRPYRGFSRDLTHLRLFTFRPEYRASNGGCHQAVSSLVLRLNGCVLTSHSQIRKEHITHITYYTFK
jgi:hypothetical protein